MAKSYKKNIHSNILNKGISQYNPTTGLDETVSKNIANRNNKVSSSKSKEMTKKRIKINSNPVPKTTIKTSSPTNWSEHAWYSREGTDEYGRPTFDNNKKVDNIKINSNPNKSGKTVIGNLARGAKAGGLPGLALGAIAAYKAGLKQDSKAKKRKNRMN